MSVGEDGTTDISILAGLLFQLSYLVEDISLTSLAFLPPVQRLGAQFWCVSRCVKIQLAARLDCVSAVGGRLA
jgi:hypothetical protein